MRKISFMSKTFLSFLFAAFVSMFSLKAQQWPGYTLYATQNGTTSILCDTNGTTWKTWTFAATAKTGYSTYLMPGGFLWRAVSRSGNSFTGGPICGEVQKVDYSGTVVWDFVYSTTNYCTHHDICPMPNGNVLLISYELKTAAEATTAGSTQAIIMWPDKIVEVQPTGATTGTVVWEWHVWDHLVQNVNSAGANYQSSIVNHPELLNINYKTTKDWMHMNGVDYNPILDQVIFSSHNLNEWYVVDHSTTTAEAATHTGGRCGKGGDFLYRWGNPAAYSATGTAVLNVTHDAHWIPEGSPNAGRMVGFNNKGVSSSQSSIDQINPPISGYTYTIGTPATYDQRLACNGYSSNMGNSQQLPNGNMLVCVATAGTIYETDPAGTTIWTKSITGSVPQAFRYDTCYINHPAPVTPTITVNGSVLQASAASTYQWYLNAVQIPGATSQNYTPLQSGYYLVRITDQFGCVYMYSKDVNFTVASGLAENADLSGLSVFPNPASGIISIANTSLLGTDFRVQVLDVMGNVLVTEKNVSALDLSGFANGVYLIYFATDNGIRADRKVTLIK